MKQILQNFKSGETILADLPAPRVKPGYLLIQTSRTLISLGTERMLVEFGRASLVEKARQQPDRVKQVLDKIRVDGLVQTYKTVKSKLDQPIPLGYCNVGTIIEVGSGVTGFKAGERVISNGPHAEIVAVPVNLCAKVPDNIDDEDAVFTVLGAIALQGVRLIKPTLGETVVVTGLGLIGLLGGQILKANGCQVIGLDTDQRKVDFARQIGLSAELIGGSEIVNEVKNRTEGHGADAVLIAASTKSDEPIHQAANMLRKRGRIVLVGVTGLNISRSDFYEKEISFQVSCSYGPGRYDYQYEEKGQDYPRGHVRWTEQRNFQAFLQLVSQGSIQIKPLITDRFKIDNALNAYREMSSGKSYGLLIEYSSVDSDRKLSRTINIHTAPKSALSRSKGRVGLIGAGNFTSSTLLPLLAQEELDIRIIASDSGIRSSHLASKYRIPQITSDPKEIINHPEIDAVIITTPHDSHAQYTMDALNAQKAVYVEKPLGITKSEISQIESVVSELESPILMPGFNRRFAPMVNKIKEQLGESQNAVAIEMTINAGEIDPGHWIHDPEVGGGRVIGEGCHFIDLARVLAGTPIVALNSYHSGRGQTQDNVALTIQFENHSVASINYFVDGTKTFPKEQIRVFSNQRVFELNNFRDLKVHGRRIKTLLKSRSQDKGHRAMLSAFKNSVIYGEPNPIPFEEIFEVSYASIEAAK